MISPELAKKLREAGFKPKSEAYIPTLEELIETIGFGGTFSLVRQIGTNGWSAKYSYLKYSDSEAKIEEIVGTGETPDEVVAELWLKINKKPE